MHERPKIGIGGLVYRATEVLEEVAEGGKACGGPVLQGDGEVETFVVGGGRFGDGDLFGLFG